jgi:glycosyltransferase involved in cell wall biosynthesis
MSVEIIEGPATASSPITAALEATTPRTGYVVKVYPRFSETFVVTEILARERAGEQLAIYASRPTTDARFQPGIAQVQAPVTHLGRPQKASEVYAELLATERTIPGALGAWASLTDLLELVESSDAFQGLELARCVRRDGITHLHAHFATAAARIAAIAAHLTGVSYSVTTHAKDIFHESVNPTLLRRLLGGADTVVAISDYNRRHLLGLFPELADRVRVVRNGLDLTRFPYRAPQPRNGPLKVAAVGRLVEKKGFGDLIEATRQLRASGQAVEVRLAGAGELADLLAARITAAGLDDTVHLLGPRSQDEIRSLLRWADVLAAPCVTGADGNADGLPTVILEGMALGVPCISTEVTGIAEAVHPAGPRGPRTGLLVPPGDVAALTAALAEVADPDFDREEVARAARELIEHDHDTDVQSRRLAALQPDPTRS